MVLDNGRYISSELAKMTQVLDEHFRIASSAIKVLSSAIANWLDDGKTVSPEDLAKMTEMEVKGDELKRTILNNLASANTLMQREDLLRLVHYNDKLIDGAEIACYHLAAITHVWRPEGKLREKVSELSTMILEIVSHQREAIRFLSINIETSIAKTDDICRTEKAIDAVMRDVWALLYPSKVPLEQILHMRDFVNVLEEIANFSEDAANTIRGISLTLNT
ncbi:MAG: DUF47 family protein [Candidatus Thorarchaeota archaeon]|nr:DUF47 family protein [Candidatus Thorarchaeota archaeon]